MTYYVSSSARDDSNNGLSESKPFATISKANSRTLLLGERALLHNGDVWRTDPLVMNPINIFELEPV